MNKKIKRIIALTLAMGAFSIVSAATPGISSDIISKTVYASSYTASTGELKSLTVKSTNGDTLDLRDGYNGSTVKLSDDKEYYTKLTDDSDGIKINANVKGEDYIVRIFTSDNADATGIEPGEEISLAKGNTTLYIRTYESIAEYRKVKDTEDDVTICEEEYTVNIKRTTESSYEDDTQDDIYLENIDITKGDITFLKQRTSYDINVASTVDEIKITAPPEDEDDRVRIDGSLVDDSDNYKKTVSLEDGENEIKIKVTDDKDNQRTYTLNITRGETSTTDDVYLSDLTTSEGTIDFSAEENSYDVDVEESVTKVTIGAEPEDEEYLVTIDGDEVNSSDDYEKKISLSKGENKVKVVIEDEDNDKKRTYTVTINRGETEDTTEADDTSASNGTSTSDDKKTGWVQTDAGWQYNDENGTPLKASWLFDKEKSVYSYVNADGLRVTGWIKDKDKWYLLDTKGSMLTGWQYTDGKWYVLDASGAMKTGWYKEEAKTQNATNTNTAATTTTTQSNANTNASTTNASTTNSETWYYLNNEGSMQKGWMLNGKNWYYFNASGAMQKGWIVQSNSKYYLNADGTMTTGNKTIDGKEYKFNTTGALII